MTHIGVIGTGTMGSNHIRILTKMKNVDISISDVNKDRCKEIGTNFNVNSFYFDHNEMLKTEKLDGVIIAVPSNFHKSVFLDCISHKTNVFVEKPIAENILDAELMIRKSKESKKIFTVGHVERFNPVVTKIKSLLKDLGDIYLVNTIRSGPFPKRLYGMHGGVLVDLAVHDADIIAYLIGDIKQVYAHVIKTGNQEIYANALFTINTKIKGSSEFSWISPKRVRKIEIYGTNGMLVGDYHNQTLNFYENSDSEIPTGSNLFEEILLKGNISEGKIVNYPVEKNEPLKLELQSFIENINNKTQPLVKLEEAVKALKVALSILESAKENMPVKI